MFYLINHHKYTTSEFRLYFLANIDMPMGVEWLNTDTEEKAMPHSIPIEAVIFFKHSVCVGRKKLSFRSKWQKA